MTFRIEIDNFLKHPDIQPDPVHEGVYHLTIGIFELIIDDQQMIVALRDTEDSLTLYHMEAEEDFEFLILINEALKVAKKFGRVNG